MGLRERLAMQLGALLIANMELAAKIEELEKQLKEANAAAAYPKSEHQPE